MSNMNKDIMVEIKLGEYMKLVEKANKLDAAKVQVLEEVRVEVEGSDSKGNPYLTATIGSGKLFRKERRAKMFEMVIADDMVMAELFRRGQHNYSIEGEYFTELNFGAGYQDLLLIPEFATKWEALKDAADEANCVDINEEVEADE